MRDVMGLNYAQWSYRYVCYDPQNSDSTSKLVKKIDKIKVCEQLTQSLYLYHIKMLSRDLKKAVYAGKLSNGAELKQFLQ